MIRSGNHFIKEQRKKLWAQTIFRRAVDKREKQNTATSSRFHCASAELCTAAGDVLRKEEVAVEQTSIVLF